MTFFPPENVDKFMSNLITENIRNSFSVPIKKYLNYWLKNFSIKNRLKFQKDKVIFEL